MDSKNKALDAVGTLAALVEALRKPAQNEDGMITISRDEYETLVCNQTAKPGDGSPYITREQAEEMVFGELMQALSVGSVPCGECKKPVTLDDCSDAHIYYDADGDEPIAVVYCADCEAANRRLPLERKSIPGAKLFNPAQNLTPAAKVLFDEMVSNFEDWLSDNDADNNDLAMAARAVESYVVSRTKGVAIPF